MLQKTKSHLEELKEVALAEHMTTVAELRQGIFSAETQVMYPIEQLKSYKIVREYHDGNISLLFSRYLLSDVDVLQVLNTMVSSSSQRIEREIIKWLTPSNDEAYYYRDRYNELKML